MSGTPAIELIATLDRKELPARRVHGVVRYARNPFVGNLGARIRCFPRTDEIEKDNTKKQLVAYVLCVSSGPSGELRILSYTRGKKGQEARLHAKKSIGVGGHINQDDFLAADAQVRAGWGVGKENERSRLFNYYARGCDAAAVREVNEELQLADPTKAVTADNFRFYGLLNCDIDEVSSVHVAVVSVCQLPYMVPDGELAMLNPVWLTIDELVADIQAYEPWSQLLIGSVAGAINVDRVLFKDDSLAEEAL